MTIYSYRVKAYPYIQKFKTWPWKSVAGYTMLNLAGIKYDYEPGFFSDTFIVILRNNEERLRFNNICDNW